MVSTLIVSVPSRFNVWFDFYCLLIEIKIKFQYYVCCIFYLLEFDYALFFNFIILEGKFFFSKDNGAFSPLTPLMIDFSWIFLTTLSPMSATCRSDCSHCWTFTSQPLIFAIWRVARCLPQGGVILFGGTGGRRYYRRSYLEVGSSIWRDGM